MIKLFRRCHKTSGEASFYTDLRKRAPMGRMSVLGASGVLDDVESLIAYFRDSDGDGIALDADEVCGMDHVLSALTHAERAFERRENVSSRLLMEVLLYASGERQLSLAIARMGVKAGKGRMVLLLEGSDPEAVLSRFGLTEDPSVIGADDESLVKDALERVAMVDILKR